MQSIRQWLLHTSTLALMAATLACGADGPAAPKEAAANQGSQGDGTAGGQNRTETVLSVIPGALALHVGESGSLTAAVIDANGNIVQVPASPLPWVSSNTAVATVTGAGVVTAVGGGEATISVTTGGLRGSARVLATP